MSYASQVSNYGETGGTQQIQTHTSETQNPKAETRPYL
jgi:hypothetical protein